MNSFQFIDNSGQFINEMARKAETALEAVGIHLEGEAKDELENSPRRVDTGRLKNSISHAYSSSEVAEYIGTNVEYAPYVHEGTIKMAPNRFLKNAIERNEDQVRSYIEREMKR